MRFCLISRNRQVFKLQFCDASWVGTRRSLLTKKNGIIGPRTAVNRNLLFSRKRHWSATASSAKRTSVQDESTGYSRDKIESTRKEGYLDPWQFSRKRIETVRLSSDQQIWDYYKVIGGQKEPIGFGTFGSVHACETLNSQSGKNSKVALKIMSKATQPFYQREIEMLKRVRNKDGCLRLLRVLESPNRVFLATELLTGGDLFDFIVDNNVGLGTLTVHESLLILEQMLIGLQTCHVQNLAHLDVKPENYVFRKPLSSSLNLRKMDLVLVDFGASQPFSLRPFAHSKEKYVTGMDDLWRGMQESKIGGTASYISPEVFLQNKFSSRSDMWSLGVSFYMMLTGQRPFDSECEITTQKMVIREAQGSRIESIFANGSALKAMKLSPSVKKLLKSLTAPLPENRPSSMEALNLVRQILENNDYE